MSNKDLFHIKLFLGFIVVVISTIILKALKTVFLPFCISLLLYFIFTGIRKKLVKVGVPGTVATIMLLLCIVMICWGFGMMIYSGATTFIEKFPQYSSKMNALADSVLKDLDIEMFSVKEYIDKIDWSSFIKDATSVISGGFGSFAIFLGNLILVLVFLLFMLSGGSSVQDRLKNAFKSEDAERFTDIIGKIEYQVQHYLLIKTSVSALTAIVCGIVLGIAGLDMVVFISFLIFVLNFIPNAGSIIATAFPVIIGILQFGFSIKVAIIAGALIGVQMLIGNVVEPRITGGSLNLSPIVILSSLILWGWVWGIAGMILAVPLTSAVKIIAANIPALKPVSDLMGAD